MTDFTQWKTASLDESIDHILARYHDVHRQQFIEIIALAEKVDAAHQGNVSPELLPLLRHMHDDLLTHLMKEEQALFPMALNGIGAGAMMPIRVMMMEHDDHKDAIQKLLSITNNLTPPQGACQTWVRLYEAIQTFIDDLNDHIYLENEILFPRILEG